MRKIAFIGACICVICLVLGLTNRREYVFDATEKIYYGMSRNQLERVEGEPIFVEEKIADTGNIQLQYKELWEGKTKENSYIFEERWGVTQLYAVQIRILSVEKEEGRELFASTLEYLKGYYSKRKGYFCEEIKKKGEEGFSVHLGTNTGATGISVELEYEGGILQLTLINQK